MIPVLEKNVAAPGCPFIPNNGIITKKRPPRNRNNASFHGLRMEKKGEVRRKSIFFVTRGQIRDIMAKKKAGLILRT